MWPRIPDSTKFNWKQESTGQVWVWDGDDNEKMTGLSRQGGDRGGWSHGRDGVCTPHAGSSLGRVGHVRENSGLALKGKMPG